MLVLLSMLLVGCTDSNPIAEFTGGGGGGSGGDATADAEGAAEGEPLVPGATFKAKEKRLILPGSLSNKPAPPVEGISRGQCSEFDDGGPVTDGCFTGTLECGQTVVGHTRGGVQRYDTTFYKQYFCTPATTNHDGGDERVYYIQAPDRPVRMWFTLDTPCADLDLAVMRVHGEECPAPGADVPDCDMWPKPGTKREVVDVPSTGQSDWIAVVEGKDAEEGAFALTLQCAEGIQ